MTTEYTREETRQMVIDEIESWNENTKKGLKTKYEQHCKDMGDSADPDFHHWMGQEATRRVVARLDAEGAIYHPEAE